MTPYFERDGIVIYHGDCRDVLPTLPRVDLLLTDPPYGIALREHGRHGYDWTVAGDSDDAIGLWLLQEASSAQWPRIVFASPKYPWPGTWRQYLVWDKGPAVGGGGDPKTCWKLTWEMLQVAQTPVLNGKRDQAVLRYWVNQADYHWHPCQKPVALLRYLLGKTTGADALVLDPFMGSGSTLIAAHETGRSAIGIEIEERYCEIAATRLQQLVLPLEST